MESRAQFEVCSAWFTQQGTTLSDCIVWRLEDEDSASEEKAIQATSIFLNQENSEQDHPDMSIKPKNPSENAFSITAIDILCSARNLEVFGAKQEYLDTSPGMRLHLENIPEHINVYMLQYSFDEPVASCRCKLVSLQNKKSLWIHSFHVTVQRSAPKLPSIIPELSPKIDVGKVKSMLSEMGQDIPSNANSLLSAMEAMQNVHKGQEERMGAALGNMLSKLSLSSGISASLPRDISSDTSQLPQSLFSSLISMGNNPQFAQIMSTMKKPLVNENHSDHSGDNKINSASSLANDFSGLQIPSDGLFQGMNELKAYLEAFVRQEMFESEKRLASNMEKLIRQSEERITGKLDLILQKITNGH